MRIKFKNADNKGTIRLAGQACLAWFIEPRGLCKSDLASRESTRRCDGGGAQAAPVCVSVSAFTLTELLVALAILGILFGIVIPSVLNSRTTAQAKTCIANLKAIETAKNQWATDYRKPVTVAPNKSDIYGPTLYIKVEPACPVGGSYSFRAISLTPTCTIAGHSL